MKTNEVANLLKVSDSSVRLYARKFERHLNATSAGRRHRNFTELDVRKMRFISESKDTNKRDDEIHASLDAMTDDELPPFPAEAYLENEHEREALINRVVLLRAAIEAHEVEVTRLQDDLHTERERREQVEAELKTAQNELAAATGKLAVIESERRPVTFWLGVLAVVFIVVVVLAVAVIWYTGAVST
jgi:DNA-binding transcriptional MerR regulator